MKKKRILFVANTAWYLVNFRLDLIRTLSQNYEVIAVTPKDGWEGKLPCLWKEWRLKRRSLNPFNELGAILRLAKIMRELGPDLVHSYTVKPVIYGTIAARILKVPLVINSVTGLGHLFLSERLVITILRRFVGFVYRSFSSSKGIYFLFQNQADQELYLAEGFCGADQAILVQGSGIDTGKFDYLVSRPKMKQGQILFVGRMLREKGLEEIFHAASILAERKKNFEFLLAGEVDAGNPSSYTKDELEKKCVGNLRWLGRREDIRELLEECEILILPSYREGIPRSVLEAFSRGVPVIATRVPGCVHLVKDGTGVLIPPKDGRALAKAIEELSGNHSLQEEMRFKARKLVEAEFDSKNILGQTTKMYQKLLG